MKKIFSLTASIACALAVLSNPILSSTVEAQDGRIVMVMDPVKVQKAKDILGQLTVEDVARLKSLAMIENQLARDNFDVTWFDAELRGKRHHRASWAWEDFYHHRHHYYQRPQDQIMFVIVIEEPRYPSFYNVFNRHTDQFPLQSSLLAPAAGTPGIVVTQPWNVDQTAAFGEQFNSFSPGIAELAAPYAFTTDVVGAAQAAGLRIEEVARVAKDLR